MIKTIRLCYVLALLIGLLGMVSFPILVIFGGNYHLSALIIFSGLIPAFIGIGIALIGLVIS